MRRKTILATGETYHIFNRGVEKRPIFKVQADYIRMMDLVNYYRFVDPPVRFSHFKRFTIEEKESIFKDLEKKSQKLVEIFTFCLMPNHFHFQLRQTVDKGISTFITKIANGYSHYFNIKHERVGHLFQGNFGAVRIEDEEQFLHVHRYIHLNPVTSYLLEFSKLETYKFSSYIEYIEKTKGFCSTEIVLSHFKNIQHYKEFIKNQVDYSRQLDKIKHLILE